MLPTVDFCGLTITRMLIGANPFGGFSHQNPDRDKVMREYYSVDRIIETWKRAEDAGVNAMVTNNESPHVIEAVKKYLSSGGKMQWIAQVNSRVNPDLVSAIDEVVDIGCSALYLHGGLVDELYRNKDAEYVRKWCGHARERGVPGGVAGHDPEAHLWVNTLDAADFHAVCFFNCGSVHFNGGERFSLCDPPAAVNVINSITKPCIGYKIMGAGRIDARMAFEYAFEKIKPGDVVNVGMYRGDKDNIVEENAALVSEILTAGCA
jgi:hypothetical protein